MNAPKLEHMRRELLPWRSGDTALTECGLVADERTTLSRAEMVAKVDREGKQRAAMSSCMTCWQAANTNHRDSRTDGIVSVFQRELNRVGWTDSADRRRLANELLAIADLIAAHRDEFDRSVADFENVARLGDKVLRGRRHQEGKT